MRYTHHSMLAMFVALLCLAFPPAFADAPDLSAADHDTVLTDALGDSMAACADLAACDVASERERTCACPSVNLQTHSFDAGIIAISLNSPPLGGAVAGIAGGPGDDDGDAGDDISSA